jgi:hypothetical protein
LKRECQKEIRTKEEDMRNDESTEEQTNGRTEGQEERVDLRKGYQWLLEGRDFFFEPLH